MKAAIVQAAGQAAPLYDDFPEPEARPDERRIHVTAAAISQLTRARASGSHYSVANSFPFVAGFDGVGRLDNGQRVYFAGGRAPFGAMAEQAVAPATLCVPVPDTLDDVIAAALANPGMSSWAALTERASLKPGEAVLVNGATGSSGRLAVQIARHLGAGKVIVTGRNRAALAALGADAVVELVADDAALEQALHTEFAQGVDIVLDYLWGRSAEHLLRVAAKAGHDEEGPPLRFVQIGSISGANISLPGAVLRSAPIALMGSGIGSVPLERLAQSIGALFQAAVPAGLTLATKAIPLAEVASAWAQDDSAQRIVLTV